MQWEGKEGPIILQSTMTGFETKMKQKLWMRWNDERQLSRNIGNAENIELQIWPSLLMLICHILTCFILYNKLTCPYFHLRKYQPDLTNHSWDQICTKIQLDWWTRCIMSGLQVCSWLGSSDGRRRRLWRTRTAMRGELTWQFFTLSHPACRCSRRFEEDFC